VHTSVAIMEYSTGYLQTTYYNTKSKWTDPVSTGAHQALSIHSATPTLNKVFFYNKIPLSL